MRIQFIEIRNFRKLRSVRIDFNEATTLCVGANNSGKTSAMIALSSFLVHSSRLTTNDFTLSDWGPINALGAAWQAAAPSWGEVRNAPPEWEAFLPSLDVWIDVADHELHFVRDLLPTLDWKGGRLGVRLRFEPKDVQHLSNDYLLAYKAALTAKASGTGGDAAHNVRLWPRDLRDFLDKKLHSHFTLQYYLLDPSKIEPPAHGIAKPQALPLGSEPLERNPIAGIIRVDEISAQRGLGELTSEDLDSEGAHPHRDRRRLSQQLRAYYTKHLDPTEFPEAADLGALEAIEQAQSAYDARLRSGFAGALKELEQLNYPGVTDPTLTIATRLRPSDGLNHSAAVQYDVCAANAGKSLPALTLPEEYNGLGYQNLISMVFKLMSFRDAWMRVGKAGKISLDDGADARSIPRIHLVLIEEPEAYLHAQVQQVFVKKAYSVLRNHPDLKDDATLRTQMIVSTHSSHIAHECEFACLRYFRRQPPPQPGATPISAVMNLSEVFGKDDDTPRFVTRYLRATHCDLFFADAAIFVEGPAERMLVPQFIRRQFDALHRRYVTVLDIGGSHAHRFRPLIETLGLTTLVITDLDTAEPTGRHPTTPPQRGKGQVTRNSTLKTWHPVSSDVDQLLALGSDKKAKPYDAMPMFAVRVAYQTPMTVSMGNPAVSVEALATTFEDALVFENLGFFRDIEEAEANEQEATAEIVAVVKTAPGPTELSDELFKILERLDKAAFALDLLWAKDSDKLRVPKYIEEGLQWLEKQLTRTDEASAVAESVPARASGGVE